MIDKCIQADVDEGGLVSLRTNGHILKHFTMTTSIQMMLQQTKVGKDLLSRVLFCLLNFAAVNSTKRGVDLQ